MTQSPVPIETNMFRLCTSLTIALTVGTFTSRACTQEIPGLRATLTTQRSLVAAGSPVELRLLLQIDADTEVPGELLTGTSLSVTVGDQPGPGIDEPGKAAGGNGGLVALVKGTRIERTLSIPVERFVPNADPTSVAYVAVAWNGLAGANCVFKVAPDTSKVDLASLDLARTKVVLVTSLGEMTVTFRPDKAPKTVENFLQLSKSGFFDGTKFHRVIRDFMIQGGDPNTKDDEKPQTWGIGGPGYKIDAEFSDLKHLRGTLSMGLTPGDPNSAGSQFFIVHQDASQLDGKYAAFGNLESGMDTLDRIAYVPVAGPARPPSAPVQPVILHSAIVLPVKKAGK